MESNNIDKPEVVKEQPISWLNMMKYGKQLPTVRRNLIKQMGFSKKIK